MIVQALKLSFNSAQALETQQPQAQIFFKSLLIP
jgi:hypothetical protein